MPLFKTVKPAAQPHVTLFGGNRANFLSSWFFIWVFSMLRMSRTHNLGDDNLALQDSEKAKTVGDKLEGYWKLEYNNKDSRKPSIRRALVKAFGASYAFLGIYKLIGAIFLFVGSYYLVNRLIKYIEKEGTDAPESDASGHIFALGLFLCALLSSIFINQVMSESTRIGVQVRAALMVLIYRKSLQLSSVDGDIGNIVNLISNDCNRVAEACVNFHFLWSSAVEIIAMIALACVQLGLAALPALIILLILFPIQYKLGRLTSSISNSTTAITSSRVHLMSEILTAIKLIKIYAWESYFSDRIYMVRRKEWNRLLTGIVVKVWTFCVVFGAPTLAMLCCLCVKLLAYSSQKNTLDASTIFTVLALFYTVRYPLIMLPVAVRSTLGALGSFERLDEFLMKPELEPFKREEKPIDEDPKLMIYINDADFAYDGVPDPSLKFLNLKVKQGEIIAIVGDVGAGKSTVLSAIIGQIRKENGTRKIRGSISYVPHDAWLLNATLRDNILFGNDFDEKRYKEVLHVCAISRDLDLLSQGDSTEIGDRGVNLSLGQRQRVSLARAVYSDADIVLLDDPLSVMAPSVGKHIFQECILKYLENKAVIFVTNQLQFLSKCDRIMVMKDGGCVEEGTYDELEKEGVDLASLIGESMEIEDPDQICELTNEIRLEPVLHEEDELDDVVVDGSRRASESYQNTVNFANEYTINRIIEQNSHTVQNANINEHTITRMIEQNQLSVLGGAGRDRTMGPRVNREHNATARAIEKNQLTIHSFKGVEIYPEFRAVRRKRPNRRQVYIDYFRKSTGISVTFLMISAFCFVAAVKILSDWWLTKFVGTSLDLGLHLSVYGALVGTILIGVFARGVFFAWVVMRKSQSLHNRTFSRIMRARMLYFDVTPLSKILGVFAQHQYLVEDVLSDNALQFLSYFPLVIGTIIFVIVLVPWTALSATVLIIIIWLIIHYSKGLEMRFKFLGADSKPPIFAHLSASLEGLASIRVYNAQTRFDSLNLEKIDVNNKALFGMMQVKYWQSLYIDIMASIFVYTTALFVVVFHNMSLISPSVAGLAVANALQLLIFGQWTIHSGRDVATNMDSVQQLLYFREDIQSEAPNIIEDNRPPQNWGERGEIEFKQVTLKYTHFGVEVLKNISFHIRPREKVGIVGKTGSGKSTLFVSLLRIVELAGGQIFIDDLDISTIGLRDLRNKIAIIPQEPVIFAGTIRSNLDPFNKCADDEIWDVLKEVHLFEKVKSMHDKLDTQVLENGRNFSLGQRQLFCIARALLKKTNILVLDEATSAVDPQTDAIIRDTIKRNFGDHTILTIAHRLNTIMEADRILCLDEGRVVEFDAPGHLLDNPEGFFYNLVARMGPEATEKLRNIAGIQNSAFLNDGSVGNIKSLNISTNVSTSGNAQDNAVTPPSTPTQPQHHRTHMPPSLGEVFQRLSDSNAPDKNDVK